MIGIAFASGDDRVPRIAMTTFHIPAQPLIGALELYSRQSGVQVMFETASAASYQSPAVDGDFTPYAALRLLLKGTNLSIHYSRARAVIIAPSTVPWPVAPSTLPLVVLTFSENS